MSSRQWFASFRIIHCSIMRITESSRSPRWLSLSICFIIVVTLMLFFMSSPSPSTSRTLPRHQQQPYQQITVLISWNLPNMWLHHRVRYKAGSITSEPCETKKQGYHFWASLLSAPNGPNKCIYHYIYHSWSCVYFPHCFQHHHVHPDFPCCPSHLQNWASKGDVTPQACWGPKAIEPILVWCRRHLR